MAAKKLADIRVAKSMEAMGVYGITRDIGMSCLGSLLNAEASGVVACMPMDWAR